MVLQNCWVFIISSSKKKHRFGTIWRWVNRVFFLMQCAHEAHEGSNFFRGIWYRNSFPNSNVSTFNSGHTLCFLLLAVCSLLNNNKVETNLITRIKTIMLRFHPVTILSRFQPDAHTHLLNQKNADSRIVCFWHAIRVWAFSLVTHRADKCVRVSVSSITCRIQCRHVRAKMVDAQCPKSYVYTEPDLKAHL